MLWRPRMNKVNRPSINTVMCLKLDAFLFIVYIVHVVRITGSLFSDYDIRVSECDYVTTGNCL
jgi:hypothetical protein